METLKLRPHHVIDIVTRYGEGRGFEPSPSGHAVHAVAIAILSGLDREVAFVVGADEIQVPVALEDDVAVGVQSGDFDASDERGERLGPGDEDEAFYGRGDETEDAGHGQEMTLEFLRRQFLGRRRLGRNDDGVVGLSLVYEEQFRSV